MTRHAQEDLRHQVSLLDVVGDRGEIRRHPLRSLIALFNRVWDPDGKKALMFRHRFDDDACDALRRVLCAPRRRVSEAECRTRCKKLVELVPDTNRLFEILEIDETRGLAQLIEEIATLVSYPDTRIPTQIVYTPTRLFEAPPTFQTGPAQPTPVELQSAPMPDLRVIETEIAALEGAAGWTRSPGRQAKLESLRARRAQIMAPDPEPEDLPQVKGWDGRRPLLMASKAGCYRVEWHQDFDNFFLYASEDALDVTRCWERRLRCLGGKVVEGDTRARGHHAYEEFWKLNGNITDPHRVLASAVQSAHRVQGRIDVLAVLVSEANRHFPGAVGHELMGDLEGLMAQIACRLETATAEALRTVKDHPLPEPDHCMTPAATVAKCLPRKVDLDPC